MIKRITRSEHANKRYRRLQDYRHARDFHAASMNVAEVVRAVHVFPLVFQRTEQSFRLAALMGLQPAQNLFVAPDHTWSGSYIPAIFRSHPFVLARAGENRYELCIRDEDRYLTSEEEGELLFDAEGAPSPFVQNLTNFLQQMFHARARTEAICAVLAKYELIQEWPIKLRGEDGEKTLAGLYGIDEARFGGLNDAALLEMSKIGAWPVVYAHLFSKAHLPMLGQLAAQRGKAAEEIFQIPSDDTLNFDF